MIVSSRCLKASSLGGVSGGLGWALGRPVSEPAARLHTGSLEPGSDAGGGGVAYRLPSVCPSQVDRLLAIADFGPPDEKEDCVQDDVRYVGT